VTNSLSIILPVRNAEATLARQVSHLLDVLPDLTGRFEILIVDDASSDHTVDLARDLAAQFPQLVVIRHDQPRGTPAAIETGMQSARYTTLFVLEEHGIASPTDLRRLWSLRTDRELVMARTDSRPGVIEPKLLERLGTWGQALKQAARQKPATSGIQMIRRDAAERLHAQGLHSECAELSSPSVSAAERKTFLAHLKSLTTERPR
jgi:glycosyltransferase involved in cell wall biosynthesis